MHSEVIEASMESFCPVMLRTGLRARIKPRANGGAYLGYGYALIELTAWGVTLDEIEAGGVMPRGCDVRWMQGAIYQTRLAMERDGNIARLAEMAAERIEGLGV